MSAARLDEHWMEMALRVSARNLGDTWPNPSVGCVIVDGQNKLVSRGWTQAGGRPHAETQALTNAAGKAKDATAYVTLEPCAHQGGTGPCAQALINAGIKRVVTAVEDPDPRVAGRGHAMLRAAGVEVTLGVMAKAGATSHVGFFSRLQKARPFVTLKLAATLDGKIALKNGESRWITGEPARRRAHLLRARHDAVMVGIGTALADDPELTCRLDGITRPRLVRIVADAEARLPLTSKLATSAAGQPVWLLCAPDCDAARTAALAAKGVRIIPVPRASKGVDLKAALAVLATEGLTRMLVEGGASLASAFMTANLVDRLAWFHAPSVIGTDGMDAVASLGLNSLKDLAALRLLHAERWGKDVLETYAVGN